MKVNWTYEGGQLIARNEAGEVIADRIDEEGLFGRVLADALNVLPDLGECLAANGDGRPPA